MANPLLIWDPSGVYGEGDPSVHVARDLPALDRALADKKAWALVCFSLADAADSDSVLDRVRRDPSHHWSPVLYVNPSVSDPRAAALRAVSEESSRPGAANLSAEFAATFENSFVSDLRERAEEMRGLVAAGLDTNTLGEMYRIFHTLKGMAGTLQYPHLGRFLHAAEGVLTVARNELLFRHPFVTMILEGVFNYLDAQSEQMRAGTLLPLPSHDLLERIDLFRALARTGWTRFLGTGEGSSLSGKTVSTWASSTSPSPSEATGNRTRVRLTTGQVESLSDEVQRFTQLRTRLSVFANTLASEFPDESFPKDLLGITLKIGEATGRIHELVHSIRVASPRALGELARTLVAQTAHALCKSVDLEFRTEPELEIERSVLETLESVVSHLIRNAVDHGIESPAERAANGKSPVARVSIELVKIAGGALRLDFCDDGRGIDRERLRAELLNKGLLSPDAVSRLSDASIDDLIFTDGLSTKTEVSAVSGRGVGMGAVREGVVRVGGSLRVESTPGAGTHFTITLPRVSKL